jgi:glycosyltransferase involved in cell wall biosynthesis
MVIGMILDKAFPPDPRVENEAVTLAEHGHEVHLYCMQFDSTLPEREVYNGIHVHRFRFSGLVKKLSALAYTLPFYHLILQKSLKAFISEHRLEALHIHDIQVARAVFWANKTYKLPINLDLHENRPAIMKYYSHVNSGLGKWLIWPSRWKTFEYRYIKLADKVIVVTEDARDHYVMSIPSDPKKFSVVPNTVRKSFYTAHEINVSIIERYKGRFTLLYLGDTGLRRGLLTLLGSLEFLIPEIPEIKIVIVGRSAADDLLKAEIAKNHWQEYVDMEGWQDVSLFPSYIQAADLGISPIHRNLHHDTTYANKLFQYMAFGKPIIVSDSTAQARLVKKYKVGQVFLDQDAKDLAEKVLNLYKNPELYSKQSSNAERSIQNELNWDILSKSLLDLYSKN